MLSFAACRYQLLHNNDTKSSPRPTAEVNPTRAPVVSLSVSSESGQMVMFFEVAAGWISVSIISGCVVCFGSDLMEWFVNI